MRVDRTWCLGHEEKGVKHWGRLPAAIALALGVVALASGVIPEIPGVRALVEDHWWLTRGDVIQFVFFWVSLVLMVALSRGRVASYGLRGADVREIRSVLAAAGSVAVAVGVLAAVLGASSGNGGPGGGPVFRGGSFLKTVVSVWIVASISEEMLFRGLIQSFLKPLGDHGFSLFGRRLSLPVTVAAIGFGLIHLGLLTMAPGAVVAVIVVSATILGFIAGYYREKSGSILPAIVAHFTFNVLGAGIPMLTAFILPR
jgi:membrane protease YdiL (CAAX protease family)